uniref:Uncharacterized protein n=1 Tax=Arundo donax TaxID=35708 RepID=A0A0A9HQN5_ARUDO
MANKQLMSSSGYAFAFGTRARLLLFSFPLLAERRSGSAAALAMGISRI